MIYLTAIGLLLVLLFFSAIYSGSETGFYTLSELRVEGEAEGGRRSARLIRWLMRDDMGLLITVLIGNNLMIEGITLVAQEQLFFAVTPSVRELVLALVMTPIVFLFAELFPKDLFRHHPHHLMAFAAPWIALSKLLFLPLAWPLRVLSSAMVSVFGLDRGEFQRILGREALAELLDHGTRSGAMVPHAMPLAENALKLRGILLKTEMIPWSEVECLDPDQSQAELFERAAHSKHSRLPVWGSGGVLGYVHQLDVLRAGPEVDVLEHMRSIANVPEDLSVDRALARLRASGQRAATVGDSKNPSGLITVKDLVETISGDLEGF